MLEQRYNGTFRDEEIVASGTSGREWLETFAGAGGLDGLIYV